MIYLYYICLIIAGASKGWRDLQSYQSENTWLPIWHVTRKFIPIDSWHVADSIIYIFLVLPLLITVMFDMYWYLNVWQIITLPAGSWLAFYQSFIYCYHGYGRINKDWQHIWDSYNVFNWLKK